MNKTMARVVSVLTVLMFLLSACSGAKNGSPSATPSSPADSKPAEAKQAAKEPIVLGSTMALTGGAAFLGVGFKEVFDMVVKQVNAGGGINGREVKVIYYDDENTPEKAVQNAQKLINKDGVKVILGPSTAATSGAVQPIADKNKVIMFSMSAGYTAPAKSFGFNTSLKQKSAHEIHHEWFKKQGIKKVGMIATTDASGNISAKIIEDMNKKDGIEYVVERMGLNDLDVTPQLTRLKSAGIQALVIIGPGSPPAIAIKNAGQLGFDMPILMTHSQVSRAFANSIKDFVPKKLYLSGASAMAYQEMSNDNPLKPLTLKLANDFKKEYNKEIDFASAVAYDSINTVMEVLKRVGSDDPQKIKDVLENNFKNFQGTTAVVNYTPEDHQGTNMDGAVLLRLDPDLSWHIEWEPEFWKK